MPGPFPGMDPYLEAPQLWRGFQTVFIPALNAQLNSALPPGFAAFIEERISVLLPENYVVPDRAVTQRNEPELVPARAGGSGVRIRMVDASEIGAVAPDTLRDLFIEIRPTAGLHGDVITTIELISPPSKQPDGRWRQEYEARQRELLESQTHLLEIDLLRGDAHTVAAPNAAVNSNGPWDYLISLHRAGPGSAFEVWRNFLEERLPRVRVPLTGIYPDVICDLQEALASAYDAGPYRRILDYNLEPDPPMSEPYRQWSDRLLRKAGFRV